MVRTRVCQGVHEPVVSNGQLFRPGSWGENTARSSAIDVFNDAFLNRAGTDEGSYPAKGRSHASTEEVSERAA